MSQEIQEPAAENQLNIELTEEIAEGHYSNLAIISYIHSEFVIDFIRVLPGLPKAKVKSRIILTPQHAKRLLMAIGENVQRYESNFGEIDVSEPGMNQMGYNGPTGLA
jgi:hypothetical protein